MFGRYLGFGSEGFLSKLVPTVVDNFGSVFPELESEKSKLVEVLDSEEVLFNHTLDRGLRIFEEEFNKQIGKTFPAEAAFKLYDTYGFPVDLTEVLVRERGLTTRSPSGRKADGGAAGTVARCAGKGGSVAVVASSQSGASVTPRLIAPTEFVGFDRDEAKARLVQVVRQENKTFAIVDRSPLYAEMGGQVSDTGEVVLSGGDVVPVQGVAKQGQTFYLKLARPIEINVPAEVFIKGRPSSAPNDRGASYGHPSASLGFT